MTDSFAQKITKLGGSLSTCHPKPVVIGKRREETQGCGHVTRALLPFEGGQVFACKHCDCASEFPRVKAA